MTHDESVRPTLAEGEMVETAVAAEALAAPVTAEQLGALDDDFRGELVRGVLVPMSPNHPVHGRVAMNVAVALTNHVQKRALGSVFGSDVGYVLRRRPDTVRAPDASYISNARMPAIPRDFYIEAAPDLAVEVQGTWKRTTALLAKAADYLETGSRLVWVVFPSRRTVFVLRPDEPPEQLGENDTLDGGDVLPGFRLPVAEMFAGVPREGE